MSLTHCSWLLEGLLHAASCCIYWTGNLPLILLPLTQLQRMLHEQVFRARNGTACAVPHCCSAYRKLASCFADTVSVALCALHGSLHLQHIGVLHAMHGVLRIWRPTSGSG